MRPTKEGLQAARLSAERWLGTERDATAQMALTLLDEIDALTARAEEAERVAAARTRDAGEAWAQLARREGDLDRAIAALKTARAEALEEAAGKAGRGDGLPPDWCSHDDVETWLRALAEEARRG